MNVELIFTEAELSRQIIEDDMSARSYHCLKRAGINTVGDLVREFPNLCRLRGFGITSAKDVKKFLLKVKGVEV